MTETIEGTAVELEPQEPIRALVVAQPGQALVAPSERPAGMIAIATALADALKNIIDKQHLYTEIRGKRYPQVEAWMTIGRLDNVVAREAERPIRNEDGSYEGFVELVRLSDGMVIGRASALCGMPDDEPWGGTPAKNGKPAQPPRAEYARRSMAVTRATSRAFRQQYSWIMALAGYEPTPADEMPQGRGAVNPYGDDESPDPPPNKDGEVETLTGRVSRRGIIRKGGKKDGADGYQLVPRQTPDGYALGFRLEIDGDKAIPQVLCAGPIGASILTAYPDPLVLIGTAAKVAGVLYHVRGRTGSWYRLHVDRFENDDWIFPADPEPALPEPPADLHLVGEKPA